MSVTEIRWGILGTGRAARDFAHDLLLVKGARLEAVGSRKKSTADLFASEFAIHRSYASYEELVADREVDVIYVATPHALHRAHTLLALDAGKPVLCEKPLALSRAEAEIMAAHARLKNLFLMEGMWTLFLPGVQALIQLVQEGSLGDIQRFTARIGFRGDRDRTPRLFTPDLGGGSLLDVGIYPVALATRLFGEPLEISATAQMGKEGCDEATTATLTHPRGVVTSFESSITENYDNVSEIRGTEGVATLGAPWWHAPQLEIRSGKRLSAEVMVFPRAGIGFEYEILETMRCIRNGEPESRFYPLADSLRNLDVIDRIRDR